jgi:hypothetical protein
MHSQGARDTLQGYPSSIDQDLALLRSGDLEAGSHEQAAILVRVRMCIWLCDVVYVVSRKSVRVHLHV